MAESVPTPADVTPADQAFRGRPDLSPYGDNARILFALQLRFEIEDIDSVATTALVDGPDDKKCDLVYLDRDRATLVVAQGYPKPRQVPELLDLITTIARDYRVNTETVAIRMKELSWITDKTLDSFRKTKPAVIPRRDKADPDLPPNLSERQVERLEEAFRQGISPYFMELLRRALTEDKITWGRFAELLDMTVEESREFIGSTGMAI
jgi:hypothetical protein